MLVPLVCLLGLTLAGHDGPTVSALPRASGLWAVEVEDLRHPGFPLIRPASTVSETPLDDEVEEFPEEPEGDDEDDPGEAMRTEGPPPASAPAAILGFLGPDGPIPPFSPGADPPARPCGSTLSLLCRLRI